MVMEDYLNIRGRLQRPKYHLYQLGISHPQKKKKYNKQMRRKNIFKKIFNTQKKRGKEKYVYEQKNRTKQGD